MRILLTGAGGQVGWELARTLAVVGEVVASDADTLDLADRDALVRTMREVKPALVVNPAAYTAVDRAESDEEKAMAVNGTAPGILAEEARRLGAALLHFSTDYVFDGTKAGAYAEDDAPRPLNAYGRTKLAGEQAVAAAGGRYAILRTSWVYSMRGANFLLTMLRLGRERDELRVIDDQHGAPTWARALAETAAHVAMAAKRRDEWPSGIYHATCGGVTNWHGFAEAIFATAPGLERRPKLVPIPTSAYPTPARRPANSVLDNRKLEAAFGLALPSWQRALALCLQPERAR